jgi:nicotinate-nucleotide pyrophosphorylase (carboxylating)
MTGAGDHLPPLPFQYEPLLRRALAEDLGRAGDLTTLAVVPAGARATARLLARRDGTLAGLEVALAAFRLLEPGIEIHAGCRDGEAVKAGATLAELSGPARPLLSAERVALNLLGRLSGIATATRGLVDAVAGTAARVTCTRKTTPGLRALEKYAVRCGGGANHRFGLDDAILIKDNHRVVAGGITAAVERARAAAGHLVKVEVEVDSLEQLEEALRCPIDAVLLDNFAPPELRRAVDRIGGRVISEASGGIDPRTARAVAEAGVDVLSVGWITHSAPALDVALDVEPDA